MTDQPNRYEQASEAARRLLAGHDEIDLAEMLATAQARLADAETAIARVRELHYQQGDYCAICTVDFGRLCADWPCPTTAALDEPAEDLSGYVAPDPPIGCALPADAPAGLREQYAQAIAADDGHPWNTLPTETQQSYLDNADAVLAVRDSRHEALKRAHVALAEQAGRDQRRAAELEQALREVLDAKHNISQQDIARWRAVLDQPDA